MNAYIFHTVAGEWYIMDFALDLQAVHEAQLCGDVTRIERIEESGKSITVWRQGQESPKNAAI